MPSTTSFTENSKDGSFKRQVSSFREIISNSHPIYKPEPNRYWLYVSLACPWTHRTLIARHLMKLTSIIGVSVVHWHLDEKGWKFTPSNDTSSTTSINEKCYLPTGEITIGEKDWYNFSNFAAKPERFVHGTDSTVDHINGFERLSEVYFKSQPEYKARFTVPVLYDTKTQTIVNNESSEILRMLSSNIFELNNVPDLYPEKYRSAIDEVNSWVYDNINNGVYKTGFAENSKIYEEEVRNVFEHLDKVEDILSEQYEKVNGDLTNFYLVGEHLTEADIRLYVTIVRFDPVYVQHFKCNFRTIRDGYPMINLWLKNLYWNNAAFNETTGFKHIKWHYTKSHKSINKFGITPLGPIPNIESYQEGD
ncbi:S-glutathionyl-(chloro)hydroquinone reductase SCDLUD_003145 [Saccharomycodes ludwigii]|uniref:S-glutathionyl-(chloro)hydroquinone reductase n=1 Tax=Saccharomycodes ludwigii TaxID=36035 RepID=UPI001E8A315F|nr:hypothetical protein SCDLUD_003145 [Saccharomycodes ludwigii]KAH3900175.1 hypothetical protein SCDLUD_003145 [Saccharomycodes ludwigii]